MSAGFDWNKEAELQWNSRAQNWNKRSVNMWENGSRKDIVPFLSTYLDKGSKVLDIGCGDGYGSLKLHKEGYEVTGVDLSSEMITLAKNSLGHEPIEFLQGNITELPFPENHFNGVLAVTVLEWTEDPLTALKEVVRVVKKDGFICIAILGPTAGPRERSYPRLHGEKAICNTMMPWELLHLASELKLDYKDGLGVYKKEVETNHVKDLPRHLRQALSFMWINMFQKVGD